MSLVSLRRGVTHRSTRRQVLAGAGTIAAGVAVAGTAGSGLAQATPVTAPVGSPAAVGDGRYLFVGDRTVDHVSVYSIPGFELAGTVNGVTFGTHGGTLLLPDGRLLFADTARDEIVALAIDASGTPVISDRVAGTFGGSIAWIAASPDLAWVAFGSLIDESETQTLNLLEVASFTNTPVDVIMNEPEEIHAWLLGDPPHLHIAIGGQVTSHLLNEVLAGDLESIATVEVDLGSHGGATDVANGRLYYVTAPGLGFDVLDAGDGPAAYLSQIPWDLDGFSGGRNARPRVTADGQHVFGVMTPGLEDPTTWATNPVSNHITDFASVSASRVEVGPGNFGFRWGISDRFAVWAGYDGEDGTVYLLDADSASPTFGTVIQTFPIDLPTNHAVPGEDFNGSDTYATAITADSHYAFVSINGDGIVKVFDLEAGKEIAEIALDLPLAGYDGYLTVIESGLTPVDVWGR